MPSRRPVVMRIATLALGAALLNVCTDQAPGDGRGFPESELPTSLQVSNPVAAFAATAGNRTLSLLMSEENVVYVSLPAGAAPQGTRP
jgi:hypothetical protein